MKIFKIKVPHPCREKRLDQQAGIGISVLRLPVGES